MMMKGMENMENENKITIRFNGEEYACFFEDVGNDWIRIEKRACRVNKLVVKYMKKVVFLDLIS